MDGERLDLTRPRSVGELLQTTLRLFASHSGLFLSLTLLVVAPAVVLVDGAWGGELRDGAHTLRGTGVGIVSGLLTGFVIPPLVTALHAVIVRSLGAGVVPSAGQALREAAPRFPAAIWAILMYTLAVVAGLIALIVPGLWVAVRWYFGAQIAVLEGVPAAVALQRSAVLVKDQWWRTFGALLLSVLSFGLAAGIADRAIGGISNGVAYVSLAALIQALSLSLTALFGTLLFFTLRAHKAAAPPLVAA